MSDEEVWSLLSKTAEAAVRGYFEPFKTPSSDARRRLPWRSMRPSWMACSTNLKNELDCIKAFSETDFTEDLKKFDVPTIIIHGDDDQIVPIAASATSVPTSEARLKSPK
jgi:pimeloyl-ACP methyl ester carboxylesterase